MPPTDPVPAAPQEGNSPPQKPNEINLDAILLPKKEVPQNTERVNAGVLFEQEQSASLPKPEPTPAASTPPKNTSIVKPLQTFKGDIESLIQDKNVSMVTIAAAEAEKRAKQAAQPEPSGESEPSFIVAFLRKFLMIMGGVALLGVAVGLGVYVFIQLTATVEVPVDTPAPFISVDKTTVIAQPQANLNRATMMQGLENAKAASTVSLGLIDRLLPAATTQDSEGEIQTAIPAALFLPLIAPTAPEELIRTLAKEFLLGVHIFDGPQAFLILRTDSYERAFAAMLAWEGTMQTELTPLFTRDLVPKTPAITPPVDTATSTATTTPQELARRTQPGFVDRIVENRDTRVVLNETEDILLLWTFLDRNTIVITTNEYTLREIISRLGAPVTPGS
jgi:hypothetical protein